VDNCVCDNKCTRELSWFDKPTIQWKYELKCLKFNWKCALYIGNWLLFASIVLLEIIINFLSEYKL